MTMTLDQVEKLLQSPPSQIFAGDTEVRHRALAQACHPDKFPGDLAMQERATGVFQKLEAAWVEFQKPPTIYQSKDHRYTVLKPLGKGDVSRVCLAQREDDAQVAIKVSYIRDANKLLDQEAKILADLHLQANAKSYAEYLPMPLELFSTPDGLRVAVQSYREGFYTAQEILTRHPDGLEPRHIAWMLKRVLTVLGFTHRANYIHSGLTPRHVMFHAENHGCQVLSWIHAARNGQPLGVIPTAYKAWYPEPELKKKAPVSVGLDLYMVAKVMTELAGKQPLPPPMRNFLGSFLLPDPAKRAVDAWQACDEFTELLLRLFGKPRYIPLVM